MHHRQPAISTGRRSFAGLWPMAALSMLLLACPDGRIMASEIAAKPAQSGGVAPAKPAAGPKGRIETFSITLERPDDTIRAGQLNFPHPDWRFPEQTASNVVGFLQRAGVAPADLAVLSSTNHLSVEGGEVIIAPPPAIILGLRPDTRRAIYTALGTQVENPYHRQPFFFSGTAAEWLENSGLSPGTEKLLRGLMYQRGKTVHFADPQVVTGLPDAEKFRAMKMLSRVSSLVAKLHVDHTSDAAEIARQWGVGGRERQLKPLIESMTRLNGGAVMDVTALLPSFARLRLYTFPNPTPAGETPEDCFWTAMNFFSATPDPKFHNFETSLATLRSDYSLVEAPYRFGDVVTFLNSRGKPIHACVYLSEDIVFTKNGAAANQPWILMKLEDVSATYLATEMPGERLGMAVFRRKGN